MRYRAHASLGALLLAAACYRPGSDEHAFRWSTEVPAGTAIHLRDGAGNITVRRSLGQQVTVNGGRRWRRSRAKDVQFEVVSSGNDIFVCAMWRGSGKCGASGYRGRSTGGILTMFSLFHRGSDATADFVVDLPSNVRVDAKTTNGSVNIDGAASGVTAKSTNGNVTAVNVSGPVALSTTNGNVGLSIDSVADADSIRVSTTNGNIHAEFPAALQGVFDLSASNGRVHSDLPLPSAQSGKSMRHIQGQVGTLARLVRLHTMNGMVSVTTRGGAAQ
ncbi:MAG TPA: DUF4097 family beta strand repeat-containing protein [Gemmatimonadaceae bacterium]|jgi:hypothetical protein|nr:DUF4097 family beta strand repeat-containing protein [Gemmatimonadaceae bacterium]